MKYRSLVARALADAFMIGPWQPAELHQLGAEVLGARPAWLASVVRAVLRRFPTPPEVDEGVADIAAVIGAHRRFCAVFYERDTPRIRRWLGRPPSMGARPWPVPPVNHLPELAQLLDVELAELEWLADGRRYLLRTTTPALGHYHRTWIPKRSGGYRLLETPKRRIKALQRRVLRQILDAIPVHPCAEGFVRGRSVLSHAARHEGSAALLCLDLEDFFPSIPYGRVYRVFRCAGYPIQVARALAGLCTTALPPAELAHMPRPALAREAQKHHRLRRNALQLHLPQGAPTSPALANLCTFQLDRRLAGAASAAGIEYSRYADDLAFSGGDDFQRGARSFATLAAAIAIEEGFSVNFHKTRIQSHGTQQRLCGLVINVRPNIPRDDYDRLKATLTNCRRHGASSQNRENRPDFRSHLRGRVAWVESVAPARGAKLRALFEAVDWAAAPVDRPISTSRQANHR
jgi:RNA-directed DNA polymerase